MCDGGIDLLNYEEGSDMVGDGSMLADIGSDVTVPEIIDGSTTIADTYDTNVSGTDDSIDWSKASDYSNEGRNYQAPETTESDFNENYSNEGRNSEGLINTLNDDKKEDGAWTKAANFLGDKKNEKLLSTTFDLGKGLYGMYEGKQKNKQDRADKAAQREWEEKMLRLKAELAAGKGGGGGSSALELLAAKDALEQEQNKRYSASITGLKKPGLINGGKKLTYVGGKPVYTDDGKLN